MTHPLDRLRSELVRQKGASVLREPIERVIAELGDTRGASMLRRLGTVSGESQLGTVLDDGSARTTFDLRAVAERHALVEELERWAAKRRPAPRADARETRSATDVAEHELVLWARRLGVEDRLADPASHVSPYLGRSQEAHVPLAGTIREAALGRARAPGAQSHDVASAARKYLESCAADAAQHARREMLWRQAPSSPVLARLASSLRSLEATLRESARGRAERITPDAVTLDASVPALVLRRVDELWDGHEVRLVLAGHEEGTLAIEPAHSSPRRALALARLALDAVHDGSHPLHAQLAAALTTPTWRRLVDSLAESLESGDEDGLEERLVFRVALGLQDAPELDVALQRRGARGKWLKGVRVAPGAALSGRQPIGPAEGLALRALSDAYRRGAHAEALFALVGSPHVITADRGAPLEVRRVEARFALADEAGGVRPALALGESRIPVEQVAPRLRDASCIAHLVPERGLVLVASIERDLAKLVLAAAQHSAVVPDAERAAILPLVERVAARVPVALSPALEREVAPLVPQLFVRIVPDEGAAIAEIRTRLSTSTSAPAGTGATLVSVLEEGTAHPVLRRRDLSRELHDAHALARELGMPEEQTVAHLATEDDVLAFLAALHAHPSIEVEWPEDVARTKYVGAIGRAALRVNVKSAAEWFGVDGEIEIDGEVVKLADLLAQVRAGRRFVKLSRGRFAAIEADLRARLERAADVVFETARGVLAVAPAAGDAVEQLVDPAQLAADAAWTRIRERLATGALLEPDVPADLRATLRDYQRAGFTWLARLASVESGAVLADDMGLGKTVQALALLVHRASEGPAMVVAPTSLGDNWAREAERFAPTLRIRLHRGPGRHAALEREPLRAGDLLIASYDVVALDVETLSSIELATLVLDEAQAIKNPEAQRTKAVRELKARVRVALTGTPLENRLSELWSLVSVVHPGLLGPWQHFRGRFAQPIERDGDRERLAALSALVRPYLLRRTKEVVTPELPPRIELLREVELAEPERRLYDAERARAIQALGDADEAQRFRVLASITRLRELACDANLVVPDAGVSSSKLAALMDIVDELQGAGRQVLVFSQFVRLLERAGDQLRARDIRYLQLDGSTPAPERARLVERFQRGEATVFLLSLKAGGTGLNLTAADTVVHLDPWWNPAVEDQASDRAHRIGQDKPVTIVRLVAKDTIEESVLELHAAKRDLSRGVLEGADAAGALSATELVALIRGGAQDELAAKRRRSSA